MPKNSKSKKSGSKLFRSEVISVRLDPRLRYLAEIAARKQRRTLSSFIEFAVDESLKSIKISLNNVEPKLQKSVYDEAALLWSVDEIERFIALATYYPYLLTHDEQVMWKFVREFSRDNLPIIKECWAEIKNLEKGIVSESALAKSIKEHQDRREEKNV